MNKIAVIDGDSICYLCSKDTITESLSNVDSLIHSIGQETGSSHYYLFLSEGRYFRHQVNLEYKGKRPSSSPLKYLKTLKKYLVEEYGGVSYKGVEADDMVAHVMYYNTLSYGSKEQYVNCSPDKDVLKTVPGENFNYRNHTRGTTSSEDAIRFMFKQTLMGDSTDNITGIPGIGEKKADNILEGATTPDDLKFRALKAYQDHFGTLGVGVFEFQKNFRQVYLLRSNSDFLNEVGYVPELPELRSF
jgi:5'-3' exonuclease